MSKKIGLRLAALVLLASVASTSVHADQATFQNLGTIYVDDLYTKATAVSADGTAVVGYFATSLFYSYGFRWSAVDGMEYAHCLPHPFSPTCASLAVSADGIILVGESVNYPGGAQAVRWIVDGGLVQLQTLPAGYVSSSASGVSGDGSVIVGEMYNTTGNVQAFRWTEEAGYEVLGNLPGGNGSVARGVSADGSVIVGEAYNEFGKGRAFRWTPEGGMVALDPLDGGEHSAAFAVSADGSAVIGQSGSAFGIQATRWTADDGAIGLGDLDGGGFESRAFAVSADGSVIVGTSEAVAVPFRDRAFIWDETNGMRDLRDVLIENGANLDGWTLYEAKGVSADGRTIVGSGTGPGYWGPEQNLSWIATLPAVPDCATPGDLNVDTMIDGRDIELFTDCLLPAAGACACADFNDDAAATIDDVAPFVALLLNQ